MQRLERELRKHCHVCFQEEQLLLQPDQYLQLYYTIHYYTHIPRDTYKTDIRHIGLAGWEAKPN